MVGKYNLFSKSCITKKYFSFLFGHVKSSNNFKWKRAKNTFVFERDFLPRHIKYSSAQIQEQNRQIFVFRKTIYHFSCTKRIWFRSIKSIWRLWRKRNTSRKEQALYFAHATTDNVNKVISMNIMNMINHIWYIYYIHYIQFLRPLWR